MSIQKFNNDFCKLGIIEIHDKISNYNFPLIYDKYQIVLHLLKVKNMVLIIIEEMCLGLLVTKHQSQKLPFIKALFETNIGHNIKYWNKKYNRFVTSESEHTACKLITFDHQWDTSNWDYNRLQSLPRWIDLIHINSKEDTSYHSHISGYPHKFIDFEFCKALGFVFNE
tara:strand:- start:148 stop:654 length:507 start_codon:yes stop_codon:yes gene_type:complete